MELSSFVGVLSLPLLFPISVLPFGSIATPTRPLQVYTRCPRPGIGHPTDSSPMAPSSMTPLSPSPGDLPIALRKGTRSTSNPHPIYNFLTYHRLSSPHSAFVSTLSSVSVPQTVHEDPSHPGWKQAMVEEMAVLHSSGTWDLVTLPADKSSIGCCCVYTVKIGPHGRVDHLKALLVAKGYTQIYGSDHCYQNRTIHDSIHESIHDSVGERSDSFKESKICLNRRQNHRIANRFT